MDRNADVVIAYAESDTRWAEKLRRDLRTAGFEVVLANNELGTPAAVESAQHLVLMWSRHAARSKHVASQHQAFAAAHANNRTEHLLIQVWLDNTDLPYPELQAVSGVRDAHAYEQGPEQVQAFIWSELLRQISTLLRSNTDVPLDSLGRRSFIARVEPSAEVSRATVPKLARLRGHFSNCCVGKCQR